MVLTEQFLCSSQCDWTYIQLQSPTTYSIAAEDTPHESWKGPVLVRLRVTSIGFSTGRLKPGQSKQRETSSSSILSLWQICGCSFPSMPAATPQLGPRVLAATWCWLLVLVDAPGCWAPLLPVELAICGSIGFRMIIGKKTAISAFKDFRNFDNKLRKIVQERLRACRQHQLTVTIARCSPHVNCQHNELHNHCATTWLEPKYVGGEK